MQDEIMEMLKSISEEVKKNRIAIEATESRLNERLDSTEAKLNERIDGLQNHMKDELSKVHDELSKVHDELDKVHEELDKVSATAVRTAVMVENDVTRNINLVLENVSTLNDSQRKKEDEIKALGKEMGLVTQAIGRINGEIEQLKMA